MRFETLILLIILFNVVTAVLQKRAQKAKKARQAEEAREGASDAEMHWPEGEDPEFREEEWEAVPAEPPDVRHGQTHGRTRTRGRASAERDRVPGPERRRVPAEESRRVRDEVRNVGAEEETRRHDERGGKLAHAGRDLLERIARDLGIETRKGAERRGESAKGSSRRKPVRHPVIGAFERITPAAPVRPTAPVDGGAAGKRDRPFRVNLRESRKLREAVVLKEILDAPLARRPRRPGNGPPLGG